jgi:3-oxoacyl-[acyl-carrier-protein] synthase II
MKENRKVYIKAATQISIQKPLVEDWIKEPIYYNIDYARSIDPNFKEFIAPNDARRMGKILKRAIVTSLNVLSSSKIEHPDAIITGTGLGCIENTELFLNALCTEGESLLKPTYFMQSTHNTISSMIAIYTKTHGYNITYAHKGISFDSAVYDALTQIQLKKINNALIGAHDELTPSYFSLLKRIKYMGVEGMNVCSETAMSAIISTEKSYDDLCEVSSIKIMYKPSIEMIKQKVAELLLENNMKQKDIDAIVIGVNGNKENDKFYYNVTKELFKDIPLLHYKHIFGENYTCSSFAFYAISHCLKQGEIPSFLFLNKDSNLEKPKNILLFNQFDGKNYSFILLKAICGN